MRFGAATLGRRAITRQEINTMTYRAPVADIAFTLEAFRRAEAARSTRGFTAI